MRKFPSRLAIITGGLKMDTEHRFYFVVVVFFLLVFFGTWVFRSSMEMKTFNKFTRGQKATLQDAMFAELRVFARED